MNENRKTHNIAIRKVAPLNERLSRLYDINVDFSDEGHLRKILEHYTNKREFILSERGEAAAINSSDYAKAVLISETVKMFLREIAPKRTKRKNR